MIDITKDIQPLTTFRNNSVKMMQRLKKTRRPIILTVNGKPEAVVQDAAAYQRLLDLAAAADANEGSARASKTCARAHSSGQGSI
jgi:prevent-host-death family protein